MESLKHFALGAPFPDSPHAVASSLPTMADVRGYEEKDPRVMAALSSGYPRFVVHRFIQELVDFYLGDLFGASRYAVLVPSRRSAYDLQEPFDGRVISIEVEEGLFLVHCDQNDDALCLLLKKHLQHKGNGISSRQAEDRLIELGRREKSFSEYSFAGNAQESVEQAIAEACFCERKDVLVCASGMNAFYAAFRAVQEFQKGRGRRKWLQLGWLYLDSGCILKEFLSEGESLEFCYDVLDTDFIIDCIRSAGEELAAVVVECPTNPLGQVCDLQSISEAVHACGGVLIVDPTIASIYNMKVLPHADLLVTSLTKYAAYEGDVMAGALVVNPNSSFYGDLILRTSSFYSPLYSRDLSRLAFQMKHSPSLVKVLHRNAAALADFLGQHPAVKKVWFETEDFTYGRSGSIVTIELESSMERFYDAIKVMKGPSFGTRFTLLSPFMYLAHYDLVTSEEGRQFLTQVGLNPELIRIAVGSEPIEEIEDCFRLALDQSM